MTPIDEQKLQPLVDNHRAFLRFLERRVGSRDEAEDILQDAFGRSLDKLAGLGDEESIVRWFYRVLRNAVIDHYRRKASASRALEAFASELDEAVPPPEVSNEICGCVRTLAQTLKPEYAEAPTVAQYVEDHTYTYTVTGQGYPLKIKLDDAPLNDNYGQILIIIDRTD